MTARVRFSPMPTRSTRHVTPSTSARAGKASMPPTSARVQEE
jgi:hypothetical protein